MLDLGKYFWSETLFQLFKNASGRQVGVHMATTLIRCCAALWMRVHSWIDAENLFEFLLTEPQTLVCPCSSVAPKFRPQHWFLFFFFLSFFSFLLYKQNFAAYIAWPCLFKCRLFYLTSPAFWLHLLFSRLVYLRGGHHSSVRKSGLLNCKRAYLSLWIPLRTAVHYVYCCSELAPMHLASANGSG